MSDTLENMIFRCIERWAAARYSERHALVTSYDPDNYLAKVKLQPDGVETDWLPIETGHIGNGYGMAVGLETGDGKQTGDQVIVRFQENDFESGKIVQRVHSDQDKPPKVESGEMVMWTKWGQQVRFNKDGSLTLKTGVPTGTNQQQQQGGSGGGGGQSAQEILGGQSQSSQDSSGNPTPGGQSLTKNAKKVTLTLDNKGTYTVETDTDKVDKIGRNRTSTISGDRSYTVSGQAKDSISGQWKAKAKLSGWNWLVVNASANVGDPGQFDPNAPVVGPPG
jgi:hypothetical protein